MRYYVGLDVSDKQTGVCVLFADGTLAWQGEVDTSLDFISSALSHWGEEIDLVGLETGSLTPWLARFISPGPISPGRRRINVWRWAFHRRRKDGRFSAR